MKQALTSQPNHQLLFPGLEGSHWLHDTAMPLTDASSPPPSGTCCVLVWSACHQSCLLYSYLGGPPQTLCPLSLSCSPPAVPKMHLVMSAARPSMYNLLLGHQVLAPRHSDLVLPPPKSM